MLLSCNNVAISPNFVEGGGGVRLEIGDAFIIAASSSRHWMHISFTFSLLRGAEELGIQKLLKEDLGGGMKEFTFEEQECFYNIEDENQFFSSQERQSIIHHLLDNLRAIKGEQLGKVKFVEGQSIGIL